MRIQIQDGRVLQGTALQIVRAMQDLAFAAQDFTVSKYIAWVVDNTLRFEGLELKIEGETDEQQATSLVNEMIRTDLARRL
jgi:hypothetical protein